jgi:hypothetical protein
MTKLEIRVQATVIHQKRKNKPWVVDHVLEIVLYVHLQAKESSALFGFPHFPSA